jgi:hypothetical protein
MDGKTKSIKMYGGVVNELYYAKDNVPVYRQFKNSYHFYDDVGRHYLIAVKNRQMFENVRFKQKTRSPTTATQPQEPVVNNYDYTKLFVKMGDPSVRWFSYGDIGRQLVLHERTSRRSFIVTLMAQEKNGVKRRTGSVWVRGLDKFTLVELLNQ